MHSIARLENELTTAVAERDRKLNELKVAIGSNESSSITDEELLQRVAHLGLHKLVFYIQHLLSLPIECTPHGGPRYFPGHFASLK